MSIVNTYYVLTTAATWGLDAIGYCTVHSTIFWSCGCGGGL